jgi:NAD(P)-dependent dehydrogenase (short-subunit alcohol dehydrogenase family)
MLGNLKQVFDLTGKTAIITGAASGLGLAMAEGMAQFGAEIALVDVNKDALSTLENEFSKIGYTAKSYQCDVTQEDAVKATVNDVVTHYGKVDILAAVAGIGDRNPAEKMTRNQWDRVLNINLNGVWFFDQAVGIQMIKQGEGGSIINMASVAGMVGITTGNANYAASKGGVIALTRLLAIEWAKYNIRVNAISPVQFKTPLVINLIQQKPEVETYFTNHIPLGRMGELWEMVGPTIFLASNASSMVTGIVLPVDGGNTAAF